MIFNTEITTEYGVFGTSINELKYYVHMFNKNSSMMHDVMSIYEIYSLIIQLNEFDSDIQYKIFLPFL